MNRLPGGLPLRDALERGGFLDGPEADREFWSSAEQI